MNALRSAAVASGAVLFFLACTSSSSSSSKGGVKLTIATDGTIQPDRLSIVVTSNGTEYLNANRVALGKDALPETQEIVATGAASITVMAWQGTTPLDRRDLTTSALPADSFVPYAIVLSGKCTPHVRADGDRIVSDCASGATCNPVDGTCTSADVTGSLVLPDGGKGEGTCVPGVQRCASDGASYETCAADGVSWGTPFSCGGKTCVNAKCTTCPVGDESCGVPVVGCTTGEKRCTGEGNLYAQECVDGNWKTRDKCLYVCGGGTCTGICGPGSTQCCQKTPAGKIACSAQQIGPVCISGELCAPDHPGAVVVRTCGADGQWAETANCTESCSGPGAMELNVACGYCAAPGGGAGTVARCLPYVEGTCKCP